MDEPTKLNVSLAFEPRVVIAAMQTTMMRASITAYSTAVGPSSFFRNDTRFLHRLRMRISRLVDNESILNPIPAGSPPASISPTVRGATPDGQLLHFHPLQGDVVVH